MACFSCAARPVPAKPPRCIRCWVTRKQLSGARRYVIVAITALAAIITPPDVVSQLMLAIPMLILFEGSLIIMRLGERREAKAKAAEEASEVLPITPEQQP